MKGVSYFMLSAAALVFTLISVSSCDKDKTEVVVIVPEDCPETIFFSTTIEPLMVANCSTSGCHDAGTASGGYDLEGHANIETHADIVLAAIKHENAGLPMPLSQPKLSDTIIDQFECWIDQGSLNN